MRERWAITGKVAAKELVVQMMKREAMRRPWKESAPPPEPQLIEEDMLRGRARGAKEDYSSYNPASKGGVSVTARVLI
jgi:hypothetical protein